MKIRELINRYLEHCDEYYQGSNEAECIMYACRQLSEVYGDEDASTFGPKKLKDLRRLMVDGGKLTRSGINKRIDKIRRAWKWGVSEEYVPRDHVPSAAHRGRTTQGKDHGARVSRYRPRLGSRHRSGVASCAAASGRDDSNPTSHWRTPW